MKYFTLYELCRSDTATARHIANNPPKEAYAALTALIDNVLDPLREKWGRRIIVNSGYRSAELNAAVGGAPGSHHLRGMAADITAGNATDNRRLFDLAVRLKLPYTQLIAEHGFRWLHISHDPADIRRQILVIR